MNRKTIMSVPAACFWAVIAASILGYQHRISVRAQRITAEKRGVCLKMKNNLIVFIIVLCTAVTIMFPALAEETPDIVQSQIERIVVSYAANGARDGEALSALVSLNPSLGEKWTRIMDLWETPVTVNGELPDGLPEDDSLCLVGLGFQLNPDGTMRTELIERLKVMLASSEKYPNAIIVCTGGGTAADNPTATEAGRMAEWLEAQGVDPSRLIVEDHSLTTAQNAVFTFAILSERYPQVKQIAIISSDYHIATGILLFGAEAILRDSGTEVVSNASWNAPGGTLSAMFQAGALIELSGDMETAFDIYYDNYDIHELPPLQNNAAKNTIAGNMRTYSEMDDGTWMCDGYVYKYRLEIKGRMPDAAEDSSFVYLSNLKEISFERAYMAAGLSSHTEDYFSPEEAVLVEMN